MKNRHSAELLGLPGVSGVGVARGKDGGLVITVHVESDDPALLKKLPAQLEGVPVETIRSGPFSKF